MSRKLFIDVAKGLAIILVVFDHVAATTRPDVYYAEYLKIPLSFFSLTDLLMPFFFMISAVFIRRRLENASHSNSSIFNNILATRLKPYYTLSLLFFIINVSAPESLNLPSARDMIKGITVMQSNPPITPSHTLWFLFVMFVFSFCTFIFIRILRGNMYVLFAITLVFKLYAINFLGNYYFAVRQV